METSEWQFKLPTLRERCKYAFDNSLFCDIEFSVADCDGNKVTVPANKYPLAVCSPVFAAMFYGKLAETKFPIEIQDCTKEGLQEIFRYAHSEEANLTGSNVMEVLYLAKKYMMAFLEDKCKKYLQEEIGPENVLSILPQVQKIGGQVLEEHCWEIVDTDTEQAISSTSFLNVSRELLSQVLKRDTLDVDELNLFKAVDKWVTKRIEEKGSTCDGDNKRAILGEDLIRMIRFPLMAQKTFADVVLPCKMLLIDEVTEVIQIFNNISPATDVFIHKTRSLVSGRNSFIVSDIRFNSTGLSWNYGGTEDALDFSVNKPANLVGVRLFGNKGNKYEVDMKIYINNRRDCISKVVSSYDTENEQVYGLYYGFTVSFDKPVRLEPGVVYTIRSKIPETTSSYFGSKGKNTVSAGDIKITYKTASKPNNCTSSEQGQFPSLILCQR